MNETRFSKKIKKNIYFEKYNSLSFFARAILSALAFVMVLTGCELLGEEDEESVPFSDQPVVDMTLGEWTVVHTGDSTGRYYRFEGTGDMVYQRADGGDSYMFTLPNGESFPEFIRQGSEESFIASPFVSNWRDSDTFFASGTAYLDINTEGDSVAVRITPAADFIAPGATDEFPTLVSPSTPSVTLPASGQFAEQDELLITGVPEGVLLLYTTDGSVPTPDRANELAGQTFFSVSGDTMEWPLNQFRTDFQARAVFFDQESAVVSRTYEISTLRLRNVPASLAMFRGNTLRVSSFFNSFLGNDDDTGVLTFSEAGTLTLTLVSSNSGSFGYRLRDTTDAVVETESISSSGTQVTIAAGESVELRILQGSLTGSGTGYVVTADFN